MVWGPVGPLEPIPPAIRWIFWVIYGAGIFVALVRAFDAPQTWRAEIPAGADIRVFDRGARP